MKTLILLFSLLQVDSMNVVYPKLIKQPKQKTIKINNLIIEYDTMIVKGNTKYLYNLKVTKDRTLRNYSTVTFYPLGFIKNNSFTSTEK